MSVWRLIEVNALNLLVAIFAASLLCTMALAIQVRNLVKRNGQFARVLERHAALLEKLGKDVKQDSQKADAVKSDAAQEEKNLAPGEYARLLSIRGEIEAFRAELDSRVAEPAVSVDDISPNPDAEKLKELRQEIVASS